MQIKFKQSSIEMLEVNGKYRLNDLVSLFGAASNVENIPHYTRDKLNGFTKSLSDFKKSRYEIESFKGKQGGTYSNENGVYWLAAKLDEEFEAAVFDCFKDLTNGDTLNAAIKAGSVVFNSELAAKVENDWIEFCKNCHVDFKDVNARYGSNFTKLIVKTISGYSFVNQIDGKPDANLVKRLIEQKHGEAIQALNATLSIANGFLSSGLVQAAMNTRDGKKAVYNDLKAILNQ